MLFKKTYTEKLQNHYESFFNAKGVVRRWPKDPNKKLHPDFFILEFAPNSIHSMWTYTTVGMSIDRVDNNLIELIIYSPEKNNSIVELLSLNASFHRNSAPLNLHHTMPIGRPWLHDSECNHGFISLPYLDGERLELFKFKKKTYRCLWFIPITEKERNFKIEKGCEALEQLFENQKIDYLNPNRKSLV